MIFPLIKFELKRSSIEYLKRKNEPIRRKENAFKSQWELSANN